MSGTVPGTGKLTFYILKFLFEVLFFIVIIFYQLTIKIPVNYFYVCCSLDNVINFVSHI